MRVVNQMPFDKCEKCRRCILVVKENNVSIEGRTVFVGCRNAKRCLNDKRINKDAEQE